MDHRDAEGDAVPPTGDPDGDGRPAGLGGWAPGHDVARAVLSESAEGRTIASEFIASFGAFVSTTVRPILREVAEGGGEPQLLVNGLAELLRSVADSMEFPVDPSVATSESGPSD